MQIKTQPQIAACSFALSSPDDPVQLMPVGVFDAKRGALSGKGPWRFTYDIARKLIAAAKSQINDIVVDYEHQTILSRENGKSAPASGWINPGSLTFDLEKGLMAAAVKWTLPARNAIAADEYRYISPVFTYDAQTGDVIDLINVALTNSPAIDGMDAVKLAAATQQFLSLPHEETNVASTTTAINKMLGLDADAPAQAIYDSVAALKAKADAADTKDVEIAALKSAALDPAQFVPVAVVTELQTQLAALAAKQEAAEIDRLIETNINRLPTPGLQAWAKTQSVAALTDYLPNAPEVAALKAMQTGGKAPDADDKTGLTTEELAVCSQLGYTPDEFKKHRGDK